MQEEAVLVALEYISDLILDYRVIEKTFRSWPDRVDKPMADLDHDIQTQLITLYTNILQFQIHTAVHYSKSTIRRGSGRVRLG